MPVGWEGGGKERRDEKMENGEKICQARERQKSSLHMFLCWDSFSLPDLTFSIARSSTSGFAKEKMYRFSAGPQSKCEMFCFNHLQNKRNTTVTVWFISAEIQQPKLWERRDRWRKERKRRCGFGFFFFWLVTVDLRKDKKDHIGLLQSLRAPSVLSSRWLQRKCIEHYKCCFL